jgi:hypothetical protein
MIATCLLELSNVFHVIAYLFKGRFWNRDSKNAAPITDDAVNILAMMMTFLALGNCLWSVCRRKIYNSKHN